MIEGLQRFDSVPEILQALLNERKPKPMSIRQLSRKLGYSSDRTVGMVLQGHREMAPEMLRRLGEFAQLSNKDQEYLRLLTEKQKKKRLGLPTAEIDLQLQEQKQKAGKVRQVPAQDISEITPWFSFAQIEILGIAGGPLSATEMQKHLRGNVPLADIEKTLRALADLHFIKECEGGFFRQLGDDEYVVTTPDIPSLTVRAIHRAQLARAADTLEEQAVDERELIAKTVTVSHKRIPAIKKKIREMMEELAGQFTANEADDAVVAQFNFQFYQQSHKK